jgi:hypothetical protein
MSCASWRRVRLDHLDLAADGPPDDLLALDAALDRLARENSPSAELVKARFFAGLTRREAANALGSPAAPWTASGSSPGPGCSTHSAKGTNPWEADFEKILRSGGAPGRQTEHRRWLAPGM